MRESSVRLGGVVDFEGRIGWVGGNPKCQFSETFPDSQLGMAIGQGHSTILVQRKAALISLRYCIYSLHVGMQGQREPKCY